MRRWVSFIGDSLLGITDDKRGKGALQTSIGELHQHDIHDDQRDIHKDRALRTEVKWQRKTGETQAGEARRHEGNAERDHEPDQHQHRYQYKVRSPVQPMRTRHRLRHGRWFGRTRRRWNRRHVLILQMLLNAAIGIDIFPVSLYNNGPLKQGAAHSSQIILEQIQRTSPSSSSIAGFSSVYTSGLIA